MEKIQESKQERTPGPWAITGESSAYMEGTTITRWNGFGGLPARLSSLAGIFERLW